jgi:thiol-disulfide isomerase/thioredoxin
MSFELKRLWILGLLIVAVVAWLAAGPAPAQDAQETPQEPPAAEPEEKDPYALPEGGPEELAKFIRGVLSTPPPNLEARTKAIEAMKEAAGKILTSQPDEASAQLAVQIKTMFDRSPEALETLLEQVKKAQMPKLVRQVQGSLFAAKLREAAREPGDAGEKKIQEIVGEVKDFLSAAPLQPADARLAQSVGQVLEMTGKTELAAEAYTTFAEMFSSSDDPAVAAAAKMLQAIARRVNLIGNEMTVEGTTLGGEAFDWSQYKGKVVLVDFWATWCGPCVAEVPNMKQIYDDYHDRGFEIIGISLDRSQEPLEKFVEEREIPWTIVYNKENPNRPTPEYYGVMAIPTMILVGADGTVVSLRARGEILRQELEKLLGPVEEEAEEDGNESAESGNGTSEG